MRLQAQERISLTLDVSQDAHILASNEVDGDTLATESSRSTDTVDVVLTIARQVVVDDQADLLYINTTRPHIRRNQHTAVALSEVLHNAVTLLLWHIAVHAADGEVGLAHLVGKPVHLASSVAEDDGLGNSQGIVEIAECVELPFLLFDGDKVLLQTLEGQLVTLDENAHGVCHELGGHVQHIVGQCGGDDNDLGRRREVSVYIVDLLPESLVEQLVGFIEYQHLDMAGAQVAASDHVGDTSRGSRYDMLAVVQLADVLANVCSSNASMALHVHIVAQCHDDTLNLGCQLSCWGKDERLGFTDGSVDDLEHTDGEGRGLTSTGLRLGDGVATLADLDDGTGLDSRRRLISIGVDSAQERL